MNNSLTPEYILSEVRKLQYLYGLKREIRYGQSRAADDSTESVAEHLYGMNLLAHYFLPLENPTGDWDKLRILTMITVHDLDEIETGDIVGYLKTPEMYASERDSAERVLVSAPAHLQDHFRIHLSEYEAQTSPEARFVKALDRFEPLVQIYSDFGRRVVNHLTTKASDSERIKEPYLKPFPTMYRYYRTIHEAMITEGFFHPE